MVAISCTFVTASGLKRTTRDMHQHDIDERHTSDGEGDGVNCSDARMTTDEIVGVTLHSKGYTL